MTGGTRGKPSERDLAEIAEQRPEFRRRVAGKEILYRFLGLWLAIGLIAQVVGFLLASGWPDTLVSLVADVLRSFGTALWTGVVLVALVQIVPDSIQSSAARALDEYAAMMEERKRTDRQA